ncbi:MAG: hemerythrin domain-containing protein [Myxococcota bacterium]
MLSPSPALVPTDVLIDTIVTRFHQPLHDKLRTAEALSAKVARVHGGGDARLYELDAAVQALVDSLTVHLAEEERALFPLLRAGAGTERLRGELASMHEEHVIIAELFARMRELTDDLTLPPNACNTYRRLFAELEALEREIGEHVALEDQLARRFEEVTP